jgi:ribonuclease-3
MEEIERRIGYEFRDKNLLDSALTHSSVGEGRKKVTNNERLEFLGDSVLSLIIAQELYLKEPQLDEGDMTLIRALVVETNALADAMRKIALENFFKVGKHLSKNGLPPRILAGFFEAILGAVYLDGGFASAQEFLKRHLSDRLSDALLRSVRKDYKSLLQEWAQRNLFPNPTYKTLAEEGPQHSKTFKVSVELNGRLLGIGSGRSKKEAEQSAAKEALLSLNLLVSN